jgi:AAA domain
MTDFHSGDPEWFRKITSSDLSDEDSTAGNCVRAQRRDGEGPGPKGCRFPLVRFAHIKRDQRRSYLIKGLIPRAGLIVVWGPPKCGKSFWVSDLALHVALGWAYRGRRVEPGAVLYVACEGQEGFRARIEAFRKARLADGNDDPAFHLLPARLDLMGDIDTLIADIAAQLGATRCILIVIDTLNRSLVGSESKDEDMAGYISACDRLREELGCAVIVIHHCGVESTRPRGHTSLSGAVDAQIAVKRDKGRNIVATVEFMKDGPEADEIVSRLVVVEVGTDEDGEPVTSCVVEPSDGSPQKRRRSPAGQAGLAFKQLQNAIVKAGEASPNTANFPAGRLVVPIAVWRTYSQKGGLTEGTMKTRLEKPGSAFARSC